MSTNSKKVKRKEQKLSRRMRSCERSNVESVVDLILPSIGTGSGIFMMTESYIEEKYKNHGKNLKSELQTNNR